jgi:hypothetical protein
VILAATQPLPPTPDTEDEIDALQAEVREKASLPEQDGEDDVVRESDRPVPDVALGDQPNADGSGGEAPDRWAAIFAKR